MKHLFAAAMLVAAVAGAADIPDAEVVDQAGRTLHFQRDLIAGKVVVVAFFFTSCETVCPTVGNTLVRLQNALGDRLGRDVSIVSVSIDPRRDTPAALAAWAQRFGVKSGWTLVTGDAAALARVAEAMTGGVPKPADHEAALYVVDGRTGRWVRDSALARPKHYLALLDRMREGDPPEKE
jgi:protein SCO1/2